MTLEEYYEICRTDEINRQRNPVCANCQYYYEEYGTDCCKKWEMPKEDIDHERCSDWR